MQDKPLTEILQTTQVPFFVTRENWSTGFFVRIEAIDGVVASGTGYKKGNRIEGKQGKYQYNVHSHFIPLIELQDETIKALDCFIEKNLNSSDDYESSDVMYFLPFDDLTDFIEAKKSETFSEYLLRLIQERGLKNPDVYNRAFITRQHFSKIISDPDYSTTKDTVLRLAIALRLSLDETEERLEKAGFSFSHAIMKDIILEYFITNGNFDFFTINDALCAYKIEPFEL